MKVDYIIRGGRVIDPASGIDEVRDIAVKNMRVVDAASEPLEAAWPVIDAAGMHSPVRRNLREDKEGR